MKVTFKRLLVLFSAVVLALTVLVYPAVTPSAAVKKILDDPLKELPKYDDDEVIVKFKTNSSTTQKSILNNTGDLKVEEQFKNGSKLVKIEDGENINQVIDELKKNKYVQYVQPNYIYDVSSTVNDVLFNEQWGLHNTGQTVSAKQGISGYDINVNDAWDITMGSKDIVVAVIDTGIDITHPDLAANIWANLGEIPDNGIDDDKNGYIDDVHGWDFNNDDNTIFHQGNYDKTQPVDPRNIPDIHGTHVAGIIAALANNGTGVAGIAPNVKIMPVQFIDSETGRGKSSDAIRAIEYARKMGANIINASWGSSYNDIALKDTISKFNGVFVAASGNSSQNADIVPMYPAAFDNTNIISVAATDNSGKLASFSNYGEKSVDVGAPGDSVLSTFPVYEAFDPNAGKGFRSLPSPGEQNAYSYASGTSDAAPHVSGIAALLLSMDPKITSAEIIGYIKGSSEPLPTLQYKTTTGGMVDAYRALIAQKAPEAPKGLAAVSGNQNIQLTWDASGEFDINGYNVYRENVKINSTLIKDIMYIDKDVASDTAYSYSISAVDTYGNESKRSEAVSSKFVSSNVNVQIKADNTSSVKNGDTITIEGEIPTGSVIQSAKLEQLDSKSQPISGTDIDVLSSIKVTDGKVVGQYTVSTFNPSASFVRLKVGASVSGSIQTGTSDLLKIDNSELSVNLFYSKSSPMPAGTFTITATFNKNIPKAPKISIDQPGTIDVSDEEMSPTDNPKVWKYNYTVKTGEGYADGQAKATISALDEAGNTNVETKNNSFVIDTVSPVIKSTDPANNTIDIARDKKIRITFSEKVKMNSNLIDVIGPDGSTYSTVRYIGDDYITIYGATGNSSYGNWKLNGTYKIKFHPNSIIDAAGNALSNEYVYTFATPGSDDKTPPTVIGMDPADNATNVDPNKTSITVRFSEPVRMNSNYIWSTKWVSDSKGESVWRSGGTSSDRFIISLSTSKMAYNETYTVIIPADTFTDMNLNTNKEAYTFKFTTGSNDEAPPEIIKTSPKDGEIIVANTDIQLTFNETVNEGSGYNNIVIKDSKGSIMPIMSKHIADTVFYIRAEKPWVSSETYTVVLPKDAIQDKSGNALANDFTLKFTMTDSTYPTVVSTDPTGSPASDVPIDKVVTFTYSENIQAATAFENITLKDSSNRVIPITKRIDANKLIIIPGEKLMYDSSYKISIPGSAIKDMGVAVQPFETTFNFHTELASKEIAPMISRTEPPANAANVPVGLNRSMNIYFTKYIKPGLNYANITVKDDKNNSFRLSNNIYTNRILVTIVGELAYDTTYTVTVPAKAVIDESGNELKEDYTFKFTTRLSADSLPKVTSSYPTNNATDAEVDKPFTITFSEDIQAGERYESIILRDVYTNIINVSKVISGNKLVVTPSQKLLNNSSYTLRIPATAIKDSMGNSMKEDQVISFKTKPADSAAPSVLTVDPAMNVTKVPVNKVITVTFNKDIQSGTAFENIVVKDANNSAVSISKSIVGSKLIITPTITLIENSKHTVTIPMNAIKDSANNQLLTNYSSTFTTDILDVIPPTIVSTSPRNDELIAGKYTLSFYFNESIEQGSTFNNIVVKDANNNIITTAKSGKTIDRNVLKINNTEAWGQLTTYYVLIPANAVKDLFGNSFASDYTFKFATRDSNPPALVSSEPVQNGTLSVDKPIVLTYDETIQAGVGYNLETGYENIKLMLNNTPIAITKSIEGNKLIITPNSKLEYNSYYTLYMPPYGIQDVNRIREPFGFRINFKTGLAPNNIVTTVARTEPANNAINVKADYLSINIYFNKEIQPSTAYQNIVLVDTNNNIIPLSKRIFDTDKQRILATPSGVLDYNTTYTLRVPANAVKDLAGNELSTEYTSKFTTEPVSTTSPPVVKSIDPSAYTLNVPVDKVITITFNKDIQAGNGYENIVANVATFGSNIPPITFTKNIQGNKLILTPNTKYNYLTTYNLYIPADAIKDMYNNNMSFEFTSGFRTINQ